MPDIFYVKEPQSRLFRNIGDQGEETGSKQLLLGQRSVFQWRNECEILSECFLIIRRFSVLLSV